MRLEPTQLRRCCAPASLPFETTEELDDLPGPLGQPRALEALALAVAERREGYHVYALGQSGSGRQSLVSSYLETRGADEPAPPDRCYVHNFEDGYRPLALTLPAGRANPLRVAMRRLVEDLRAGLPAAFETDRYRAKVRLLETELTIREEAAYQQAVERARVDGVAVDRSEESLTVAPMHEGEILGEEAFARLPAAEQQRLNRLVDRHTRRLEKLLDQVPRWRREAQHRLRALHRQVARSTVASLTQEIRRKFPEARAYLSQLTEDVLANAGDFRPAETSELGLPEPDPDAREIRLQNYRLNVLVDHSGSRAAPIVYEDHPTHANLVGRIEQVVDQGLVVTDYTLIKPGSLHRANGGYLIVEAEKLLEAGPAWATLKRALRSHRVAPEPVEEESGAAALQPQPIPLDLKVILVGGRALYEALYQGDPDFRELFKVLAEFEPDLERTPASEVEYARLLATLARREGLRPFSREAVACILEHSSRLAEDAGKLCLQMRSLLDLLVESNHYAPGATVGRADVARALEAQARRSSSIRERLLDDVARGVQVIATDGQRVGQVNGLSVLEQGGYSFGLPLRVTARVRAGRGKMLDVERESGLAGRLHSKGFLGLSGYLTGRYCVDRPLSLYASLVFEQCYAESEGDSASTAELLALLSALADLPLRQDLAVTGSVSQLGEVQAIGGVNEKVEGFFAACQRRGLSGSQGVVIPASNGQHLMLSPEVVEAVRQGLFHVYAVSTVDECLELLGGIPAAEFNDHVERRLSGFGRFPRRVK